MTVVGPQSWRLWLSKHWSLLVRANLPVFDILDELVVRGVFHPNREDYQDISCKRTPVAATRTLLTILYSQGETSIEHFHRSVQMCCSRVASLCSLVQVSHETHDGIEEEQCHAAWLSANKNCLLSAHMPVQRIADDLVVGNVFQPHEEDFETIMKECERSKMPTTLVNTLLSKSPRSAALFQEALYRHAPHVLALCSDTTVLLPDCGLAGATQAGAADHCSWLAANRVVLIDARMPTSMLCNDLCQDGVLEENSIDFQEINIEESPEVMTRRLLDCLYVKGPKALTAFLDAIACRCPGVLQQCSCPRFANDDQPGATVALTKLSECQAWVVENREHLESASLPIPWILDRLVVGKVFRPDDEDFQEIMLEQTVVDMVRKLLDCLLSKGPHAVLLFQHVLRDILPHVLDRCKGALAHAGEFENPILTEGAPTEDHKWLTSNWVVLVKANLPVNNILRHLEAVLPPNLAGYQDIARQATNVGKTRKLLDKLHKRGPGTLALFQSVLRELCPEVLSKCTPTTSDVPLPLPRRHTFENQTWLSANRVKLVAANIPVREIMDHLVKERFFSPNGDDYQDIMCEGTKVGRVQKLLDILAAEEMVPACTIVVGVLQHLRPDVMLLCSDQVQPSQPALTRTSSERPHPREWLLANRDRFVDFGIPIKRILDQLIAQWVFSAHSEEYQEIVATPTSAGRIRRMVETLQGKEPAFIDAFRRALLQNCPEFSDEHWNQ